MNIESLFIADGGGTDSPLLLFDWAWAAALDGFAIDPHPFTHAFETLQCGCGEFPVGLGSDIHQHVAVHGNALGKKAHQGSDTLVILVSDGVSPRMVHGLAHL